MIHDEEEWHSHISTYCIGFCNANRILPSNPQRRILNNGLSAVCQGKFIYYIDQVTHKNPNSSAQRGTHHQVSLPHDGAHRLPSFPTRPGSSIMIDSHLEGSLTAENHAHRWTGKELTNRRRRTAFCTTSCNDC